MPPPSKRDFLLRCAESPHAGGPAWKRLHTAPMPTHSVANRFLALRPPAQPGSQRPSEATCSWDRNQGWSKATQQGHSGAVPDLLCSTGGKRRPTLRPDLCPPRTAYRHPHLMAAGTPAEQRGLPALVSQPPHPGGGSPASGHYLWLMLLMLSRLHFWLLQKRTVPD